MTPSDLQLFELMLEISRGVDRLDRSIDVLLSDMRAQNSELVFDSKAGAVLKSDPHRMRDDPA